MKNLVLGTVVLIVVGLFSGGHTQEEINVFNPTNQTYGISSDPGDPGIR